MALALAGALSRRSDPLPVAPGLYPGLWYHLLSELGRTDPLVICDEEQSVVSRTIVQAYSDAEKFQLVDQVTRSEDMVDDLNSGKALVGLYIPEDLSKQVKLGNPVPLMLTVNSANNMFGNAALTAASEINKTLFVGIAAKLLEAGNQLPAAAMNMAYPVRLGIRIVNNPTAGYTPFMLAGLTMNGLQIAIMLVLCPLIAREFRYHGYEKSIPSWLILGAKVLCVLVMAVPSFSSPWDSYTTASPSPYRVPGRPGRHDNGFLPGRRRHYGPLCRAQSGCSHVHRNALALYHAGPLVQRPELA